MDERSIAFIGLIIDDLGNNLPSGQRVVGLPGPVACAILPQTPHAKRLAEEAHAHHKEVILHVPMESVDTSAPGPGGLDTTMRAFEIIIALNHDLQTVPHVVGVSNHMGSLLTQNRRSMRWLMQAMVNRGDLFFIDSRTTPDSVAAEIADEFGIRYLVRNVFLDRERHTEAIDRQFEALMDIARKRGTALGIGHPYPETLELLERHLPRLANTDIRVVPLSKILAIRNGKQDRLHSYQSHSMD